MDTTAAAETPLIQADHDVRRRLALVIDVDDLVVARRLAQTLRPWFGVAKVGLELFSAAGPDAIETMAELGYEVFADLKLHDIPTTVGKASRVLGSLGASYVTMHAFGGVDMLRAGVEGLRAGAESAGLPEPTALAVTVLTSDGGAPPHILPKRVATAIEAGCGGLVCAVGDVREARLLGPALTIVTPGIRPVGSPTHDQARAATPQEAFDAGADLLVIGRAVTAAPDPVVAAAELVESLTL
ncbi:orotidine-5'-phosphate decarboxylase [Aquihabitans sp. G128]|uniref:orotidine-5'-phosphate decarboxylase n=1 Tax=Aquihabitans sp. G128 TaxID=2849779 RepID=UPI001C22059F|nr:orotidine-5'-phosphate decarboxylase [Aquihabitans sp. G128]QXC61882.1 orotidine-5'-phosphate decarboxylase [Aquihabitans sp. G128]